MKQRRDSTSGDSVAKIRTKESTLDIRPRVTDSGNRLRMITVDKIVSSIMDSTYVRPYSILSYGILFCSILFCVMFLGDIFKDYEKYPPKNII